MSDRSKGKNEPINQIKCLEISEISGVSVVVMGTNKGCLYASRLSDRQNEPSITLLHNYGTCI